MTKQGKIFPSHLILFLSAVCLMFSGCGQQKAELVNDSGAVAYVDSTAEYPRLIFADGHTSINNRCMVRMVKLNRRMPPVYVNSQPVGFC